MAYRIDNSTAATSLPTPGAVGPNPNGYFTKGDPAGGVPATIVDDDWANMVQEELANAVTSDGTALSKTDRTQLKAKLTGRLLNVQRFTSSGTYTPTPGTNTIEIEVQAPGGASGGAPATGSAQSSCGSSASSGSYLQKRLTSGFTGGITVTIGAPGAGKSGGNGGAGGATSFGSYVVVGGLGGYVAGPTASTATFAAAAPGAPTAPTLGDINAQGRVGQVAVVVAGQGIPSLGGLGFIPSFGDGGSGVFNQQSTAAQTGTPGQPGFVRIREYS
jgi:hypothetical protein